MYGVRQVLYLELVVQDAVAFDDVRGGFNQFVISLFVRLIARQHDRHIHR